MVELWVIKTTCAVAYCVGMGAAYQYAKDHKIDVPDALPKELFAMLWLPVVVVAGPWKLGGAIMRAGTRRRALQKELDEARRKKDERDAADALKEGYR